MDDIARFSEVGNRYGEQLARGLRLTGETAEYYAAKRIARIATLAREWRINVRSVLDFGCGTGSSFALLRSAFPGARIAGFEPAAGLRQLAQRAAECAGASVVGTDILHDDGIHDVVYCNGVFHHIPPAERAMAIGAVARAVAPRGIACIWENSPFNPGTRVIMSRVEFDDDAVLLTPRELRGLQRSAGLTHAATEFHFIFPRVLKFARALEAPLRGLPLGGQYVVAGRRP